jgi:hypothetical protein
MKNDAGLFESIQQAACSIDKNIYRTTGGRIGKRNYDQVLEEPMRVENQSK